MGLDVEPVAVNLSTVQFHSIGFVDAVAQALPQDGVAGGLLELELTERMLMDDLADVKQRLMRLKALGLRISVDDFGTGYSSLGHLKELPIDKVKIDRSFVHDLPDNRDSAAITRAIIQMGRSLGITVMAEGVETEAQSRFLSQLGCDELQGRGSARRCRWKLSRPGSSRVARSAACADRSRCAVSFRPRPSQPAARSATSGLGRPLPARQRRLTRARQRELAGGRVLRDRRAAADRRAGADLDRRHQLRSCLPMWASGPIVVRCLFAPS